MHLLIYSNKRYRRVALIKNKKLELYSEEFFHLDNNKGNIYWGRVTRIESSLKSVFVDFGKKKCGFLKLDSIHPIYFSKLPIEKRLNMMKDFNCLLNKHYDKREIYNQYNLKDLIELNTLILVQIVRQENEKKTFMLSSFLSIKGKYFKYLMNSLNSKFIPTDETDKDKIPFLKEIFLKIFNNQGSVSVLSTRNASKVDIVKEMENLYSTAQKIEKSQFQLGELVYQEDEMISDISKYLHQVKDIIIEGECEKIEKNFIEKYKIKKNIEKGFNIFKDFEERVNELCDNHINLKCGGYLLIEKTEAAYTIDVNLGKNLGNDYEKCIFQTNQNAVTEIFKQIKLRNMGGLILIDFINMQNENYINILNDKIEEEAQNDFVKLSYAPLSKFCVLELSRQYTRNILNPSSLLSVMEKIIQKIYYLSETFDFLEIHISSILSEHILNHCTSDLYTLEHSLKVKLNFFIVNNVAENYYSIYTLNQEIHA
jgi:Rne/Rng family ribonuclease